MRYKTLIRPILVYGSESWPILKKDENLFRIFKRRILRKIYSLISEGGVQRIRHNNELCKLYNELDIVRVIKIGRLRWLGHHFRMQEVGPCRKLTLHKPEGTRRVRKPRVRWLESVETDLRKMGVKSWRCKMQDREEWRTILREAKVHQGLECHKKKRKKRKGRREKKREEEHEEKKKKKKKKKKILGWPLMA
jgi:hypothetical protein